MSEYIDLKDYPKLDELFNKKKDKYILDENNNVISASLLEWATFLQEETGKRIVKQEKINGYRISTVFIGLDHNYDPFDNKLHIFETMIFKGEKQNDIYCDRYSTWQEAEEGHMKACQWVKDRCKEK